MATLALVLGLVVVTFAAPSQGTLQAGFYKGKCGAKDVEAIVAGVVAARFKQDPTIVAALLRLQFHDCFVNVSKTMFISIRNLFEFNLKFI